MASEFTLSLLRAALFTSIAIVLVSCARRPLRRWGGAALVYQAWLVVPALWFGTAQRAFLRRAGWLTRSGAVYVSATDAGPASVGLLRPRIVVPRDFDRRYSPLEQALILSHEQTHIARGDAVVNLLACAFQCVFWFNPLQEIACDAIVMQRHPRAPA